MVFEPKLRRMSPSVAQFRVRLLSGAFETIRVQVVSKALGERIKEALRIIDERAQPEAFFGVPKPAVLGASMFAVFLATSDHRLWAYSSVELESPFVILNAKMVDRKRYATREFVVTILHELIHLVQGRLPGAGDDLSAVSLEEAIHDLRCYAALAYAVPTDHWAFRKYPHLFEKKN